jgi:hypothetical protein
MKTSDVVPASLLQWTFRRGNDTLMCEVSCYGPHTYGLVVAASDASGAGCELFTSSLDALQRHAQLATALRGHGWQVVKHSEAHDSRAWLRAA